MWSLMSPHQFLKEEPILPNVHTWRLEDPAHREVTDSLDEIDVKPIDGAAGKGILMGPANRRCATLPHGLGGPAWTDRATRRSVVHGSNHDPHHMRPRHVDLRPCAFTDGNKVWLLSGGLTRVALDEGELIVNSGRGAGLTDTWMLAGRSMEPSDPPQAAGTRADTVLQVGSAADPQVRLQDF